MQPREATQFTSMVAQAQQKVKELKGSQFFGGDALGLKRYSYDTVIPGDDTIDRCWRVVMTPTAEGTTMPIDVGLKPDNSGTVLAGKVEQVARTDGKFEFLIMFLPSYYPTAQTNEFYITYSGAASFVVTQIA